MSDLNKVLLIGRFTKDPELRYTNNGTAVTSFSLANNKTYVKDGEKKESVSFINCVAWMKKGEAISKFCKKGYRIAVEGKIEQRSWKDDQGNNRSIVEINVDEFQFLHDRNDSQKETVSCATLEEQPKFEDCVTPETEDIPF